MKKLIYCALALAAGLFATSCQQENLEPAGENYTVTYTVEAPMDAQTKAIANGLNVDELIYEVWWTSEDGTRDLGNAQRLYQAKTVMMEIGGVNKGTVTLNLVKDQHYTILFWAQVKGTGVYNTTNLVNVHYNTENLKEAYYANDDALAAFYAVDFVNDGIARNSKVILKRPFAQVNLATLNERDPKNNTEEHPLDYSITLVNSKMTLNKVPTQFNVATSKVKGDAVIEFKYNDVPSTTVAHTTATGAEYYYAGMNYVFAGANLKLTYDIQTRLNGSEQLATITNTIPNVPVKENYRTNIVGNLLTSKTDYEVIVDAAFNTNNKPGNIEVVGEGIVKNVDGDYEVTNERGLAYAINTLFAQGGDFYLTSALYDMTDYDVTSPSVPEGVVLNIYGETPVVTRSATVEGVSIIGLKGSMIETNDGTVSFSGIKVEGTENAEVPAFIETNNGSADFTGCETTTQDYIGENKGTVTESNNTTNEGNDIVAEDNGEYFVKVSTADELVAALEAEKDVFFVEDITIAATKGGYNKAGILQDKAQTIDGNGHTLTVTGAGATWDCAIYTNGGTIKNLTVAGAMRGIFTAGQNSDLYIDNVTFDKVVYTFNSDDGNKQYGVYVSNSTVNGWTSFSNVHKDVVFTNCSFGSGSGYAFCRPYNTCSFVNCAFSEGYEIETLAASTFENCTLNGVAVTSENIATLVVANIQNAKLPGVDGTFVSTGAQLLEALNNDNATVILANDITMAAEQNSGYGKAGIVIEPGKTINGNGKTLKVTDAGATWDCAIYAKGGTIKNLTVAQGFRGIFMGTASGDVFIENVTFDGPTYTFNSDGGNKNYGVYLSNCTIKGWTSHSDVHKEVVYTNCSFGEGSGYKFCRPYGPTEFVNCDFCEDYEVNARAKVTFKNCRLNGVALTDSNISDLVTGNTGNAGADTVVSTADEFVAALEAKKNVFFANDIKIEPAKMSNAYGKTGVNVYAGQTIDGNNNKLDVKGAGGTWDSGICTSGGLIKNLWVTGSFRGIFVKGANHIEKVVLENVRVEGTTYTISIDQASQQGLEATNSIFRGWTSYAGTIGDVKFTNCTFGAGNGYNFSRPYAKTQYVNCKFEAGHQIDPQAAVSFENCTLDGVALTTSNLTELVISNLPNVTIDGKFYCNSVITDMTAVCYKGEAFESGSMNNALWLNNYIFDGDAAIVVENKTYSAIVVENCNGNFKNDVITIKNDNSSVMILQNLDLTLAEGKKLIKTANPYYQVFMANITINGEKMTQESIAEYLENVAWYQVVEEI